MRFEALYDNMPPEAQELERQIRGELARVQQAYHEAAKPIIERLVKLQSIYPPRYVLIPDSPDEKPGGLRWGTAP